MEENLTYTQAMEELQIIAEQAENNEISMDDLTKKVARAAELIKFCKAHLTKTDETLAKIFEELK